MIVSFTLAAALIAMTALGGILADRLGVPRAILLGAIRGVRPTLAEHRWVTPANAPDDRWRITMHQGFIFAGSGGPGQNRRPQHGIF